MNNDEVNHSQPSASWTHPQEPALSAAVKASCQLVGIQLDKARLWLLLGYII